jgi:hypothetical protein
VEFKMKLAESINELNAKNIIESWNNAQIIRAELGDFLDNSLYSVYDDYGFEYIESQTKSRNFIDGDIYISIWYKSLNEDLWDDTFGLFALGILGPDEEFKPFNYYISVSFTEKFGPEYFKKNDRANKIIEKLKSSGWEFSFDEEDEFWYLFKGESLEKIDFTKPTWKRELKKFYEDSLTELIDTLFVTKSWLP